MASKQLKRKPGGMDYFRLDVNFWDNDKLRLIQKTHGESAISRYLILVAKICEEGYYFKWDEISSASYCERHGYDIDEFNQLLLACIDVKLFDKVAFYKHGSLTTKRIQESYLETFERRTTLALVYNYCILPIKKYLDAGPKISFLDEDDEEMDHAQLPKRDKTICDPEDEFVIAIINKKTLPPKRSLEINNAINDYVNSIKQVEEKAQDPDKKEEFKPDDKDIYSYQEALEFCQPDFESQNDIFKETVDERWYKSYQMFINLINDEFVNLKVSGYHIKFAQYKTVIKSAKPSYNKDEVCEALERLSRDGRFSGRTLVHLKLKQYLEIVRLDNKNKKPANPSAAAYPILYDARIVNK